MLSITKSRKNKILYFLSTILLILIKPTICKINKQGGIAVMGLDLGSEYFKVAIVKPGVPMEIALNGESKRKTPTVITIKGEDTLAGSPALTTGIKFPPKSFRYVFNLLGKDFNSPEVEKFQKNFPHYQLIPDEDHNLVMFKHDENNFSVDQIVALILKSAQEIASNHAETQVKDCVITVPVFMSQNERKRLVSIAENMANLKVLELINDNAAIALNYGMFRRKEFADKAKNLIIYDMGATRSTASVVKIETDEKTKDPVATVLGVAWDRSLGGVEFDLRIQNFLKTKFEEKNPKLAPVTKHRALAKLLAESQRVRQVLSANTETLARIENLTGDDVDLKIPITREDLETLCSDLLDRSMEPVLKALDMSGLAKEIVNEILMFGGLTRTPQIKAKLENEGFTLLANINTDEAAAIGASYRAADLSSAFRVKPFGIKNASPVQIQVEFDRETTDEETGEKKIKHSKRILFNVGATYPQKKILTFNRYTDDFEFEVNYGNPAEYTHLTTDQAYYPENDNLMKVKISGVSKALTDNENKQTKGIKVHFKMDESGIFSYTKVESLFEEDVLIPPTPKKKEEEKVEKEGEEAAGSEGKEDADKEAELDKKAAENQEKNKGLGW